MIDQEGSLKFSPDSHRWRIHWDGGGTWEITSGELIQVLVAGLWVTTRIEHHPARGGYYAVVKGVQLAEGLRARIP